MKTSKYPTFEKILFVLIALGIAGGILAALFRNQIERTNRTVEIIVDGKEVSQLAAMDGGMWSVTQRLKAAGASAIGIGELSFKDLSEQGLVQITPVEMGRWKLHFANTAYTHLCADALRYRWGYKPKIINDTDVDLNGEIGPIWDTGLFFDPLQLFFARSVGLTPVARLGNTPMSQEASIDYSLSEAARIGMNLVIFDGDTILGYNGLLKHTAARMIQYEMSYGWVELAPQYGDAEFMDRMAYHLVRVHGVPEKEMPRLSPNVVIGRFSLGARERNIRAVYARLFLRSDPDPLAYNADYIAKLARELHDDGLELGQARPYPPADVQGRIIFLLTLGTLASAILLWRRVLPSVKIPAGQIILLVLVVGIALVFGKFSHKLPLIARQALALLAGVVFPTLGLIIAWQALRARTENGVTSKHPLLLALGWAICITLFSLAGALIVSGFLTDTRFMMGAEQFRGVKLLLVGPTGLIALFLLGGLSKPQPQLRAWKEQVLSAGRAFLSRPILVIEVLGILVALGALAMVMIRSGNAPAGSAPGIEQRLRHLLEVVLWTRPRTKEFLMGQPALLLWLFLWLRLRALPKTACMACGRLGWAEALLLVAALGQADIVDTFCHVHTPVIFSLARTLNGLWLGLIVGVVLVAVWLIVGRWLGPGESVSCPTE
jgi:hypothetical protein